MKWIGQYIQSLISRFRSDVYLEATETGTIASGGNLGLDANNKIVKATSGSGDLTITNATDNRVVTSTGGTGLNAESNLTFDGSAFTATATSAAFTNTANFVVGANSGPSFILSNTANDNAGPILTLRNTRGDTDASDGDDLGTISFIGKDDGTPSDQTYAQIVAEIGDATSGQEAGDLSFKVAEYDGTLTTGLFLDGDTNADGEVDVTIGAGAASTTTIAGGFSAGSGGLSYASEILTMLSATSASPKFNLMNNNTDAEAPMIQFFKLPTGADDDEIGEIVFNSNDDGGVAAINYATFKAYIADASNNDEAGKIEMKVATNSTEIQNAFTATGLGTGSRVDVNLGYGATSTTTIAGTLTMGSTAFVNNSGVVQVATQGTIDHDSLANFVANEHIDWTGDVSASSVIHTENITDLHGAGVDGSIGNVLTDAGNGKIFDNASFTWDGDDMLITSSTASKPVVEIRNMADDATGPTLKLNNSRSGDGDDNDFAGAISFNAMDDGTPSTQEYGQINVRAHDVTSTEESGTMNFYVANHNGNLGLGLQLQGGSTTAEVDTTIGLGAASLTTIAGDLDIDGDNMTSAGAMTFTPVGKYTITAPDLTGDVFHLDADADTDNVVNIDAGALDIDTTAATTIDAAGSITLTSTATGGDAVHIDANTHGSSVVNIDAGALDIDASAATTLDTTSFTVTSDDAIFTSSTASHPVVEIRNTTDDGTGPEIKLNNARTSDGANGDYAGKITFHAMDDGTPTTQQYGQIFVRVDDATSTEESGSMGLQVATHNGGIGTGLALVGGSESAEVDATIGSGANSLTTIAGDLTVTSKATVPTRVYSYPGTSDGDHTAGDIMYYDSATASTTAGKIYYFNGSGSWTIANADAVADATGMLAVALGTDPDVDGMLLRGFVTLYDINGTEDHGAKLYLHTADGEASATAPGSGNVVRVLGYNLHNTNDSVYFNPDNSWVEVS